MVETNAVSPELDWDSFQAELAILLPALDGRDVDTPISELVGDDRILRAALLARLRDLLNCPPDELFGTISTLRDAYEWYQVRASSGAPPAVATADPFREALRLMQTRSQRLRSVMPSDLPLLYESAMDPRWNWRFRFRGTTPSFQEFSSGLFSGVGSQYLVERLVDRTVIAHLSLYNVRHEAQTAYFAVTRTASSPPGTEIVEGMLLFFGICFRNWSFRKLYAEIPGFNWSQFEFAERLLIDVEGVLTDYEYFDGRYWDHRIVSIRRDVFDERISPHGTLTSLFL